MPMILKFLWVMAVQDCMQPTKKQAEQLMACRRMMLREVGALIAEWDRLWGELEVDSTPSAPQTDGLC